jgi:Tfp pilus assembly protein PilF
MNIAIRILPLLLLTALSCAGATLEQCRLLATQKNFEEARKGLAELEAVAPLSAEGHDLRCVVLLALGDVEGAEKSGATAVEMKGDEARFHHHLARVYLRQLRGASFITLATVAPAAREQLELAVKHDPKLVEARLDLATYYLSAPQIAGGSKDKARQEIEEVIKLDELRGRILRAQAFTKEGKTDEAAAEYQALMEGPGKASRDLYANFGNMLVKAKRFAQAVPVCERLVEMDTSSPKAIAFNRALLGDAYRGAKRYSDAAAQYREVLKADPTHEAALAGLKDVEKKL